MKFKRIYIEISNICNLSCEFCQPLLREKRKMSEAEFRYIINQVKDYTSIIYFHVKGEPLLHESLALFLDIAAENGLKVNITTNGRLLKEKSQLLLSHKAVRQLNLSLHAVKEPGLLDDCLSVAKQANEKGIYTVLRLWNLNKQGETSPLGLEIMKKIQAFFGYEGDLAEKMGSMKSVRLLSHTFIGWEEEFVWPSLSNPFVSNEGFCHGVRSQLGILADGSVVPCCLDGNGEQPLGNIFTTNFSEIISSSLFLEMKRGFENHNVVAPLCRHCSFRTKFDITDRVD